MHAKSGYLDQRWNDWDKVYKAYTCTYDCGLNLSVFIYTQFYLNVTIWYSVLYTIIYISLYLHLAHERERERERERDLHKLLKYSVRRILRTGSFKTLGFNVIPESCWEFPWMTRKMKISNTGRSCRAIYLEDGNHFKPCHHGYA